MSETASIEAAVVAAEELLEIEGVHGVGQGASDGAPCVLVMVANLSDEARSAIPEQIAGFPVKLHDLGSEPQTYGTSAGESLDLEPDCG